MNGTSVAGRYAERDRVGAECAARAAVRRRAAAPGLAPADGNDADAAGPRRLLRVLAQPADVPGPHQARAADGRAAGLFDGQRHGTARRVVAEAVVAVDEQGGGGLRQDRRFGIHFQIAAFHQPQVLRDTQHPMRVVPGEVGVDQNPGHLVRDGARGAGGREDPPRDRVQMTGRESMHRRTIRPGPLAVKVASFGFWMGSSPIARLARFDSLTARRAWFTLVSRKQVYFMWTVHYHKHLRTPPIDRIGVSYPFPQCTRSTLAPRADRAGRPARRFACTTTHPTILNPHHRRCRSLTLAASPTTAPCGAPGSGARTRRRRFRM